MTERDAIEAYLKARDRVVFLWQWYVGGLTLVCGWALSSGAEWTSLRRAAVTLMVLAFLSMNASGLVRMYRLLFAARRDLEECELPPGGPTHLHAALRTFRYPVPALVAAYVVGLAVAVAFVWKDWG